METQKANAKPTAKKDSIPTYEFKSESSDIFSEPSQSMSVQVVEAANGNKATLQSQQSSTHNRKQRKLLFGIEDSIDQLPFDYKQMLKQQEEDELQNLNDEEELFEQLL